MRSLAIFVLLFLNLSTALADSSTTLSESQLYQAMEELADYAAQKDSSLNQSQFYYKILENSEAQGLEVGLIKPLHSLYSFEKNDTKVKHLQKIFVRLGFPVPAKEQDTNPHSNPRRNIDIVANSNKECVGSCIRDILDGAAKGAGIGTAIGAAGGPATAGAGAAGGAIIGGALGGAACSTRPECDKDKRRIIAPSIDNNRASLDLNKIKRKRDIVINPGFQLIKEAL